MCLQNLPRIGIRFTITDYGTIVRAGDGSVIGIYPTEDEALEAVRERCMGVLSSTKT